MFALFSTVVLAFVLQQAAPSSSAPPAARQSRHTGDARKMTLVLPHALRKGDTAWLLVRVGTIGHNQINLTTQDGHSLGTISPFGARSGQAVGIYPIPVPSEDFHDRRLALSFSVMEAGGTQRAPTNEEIKSVRLVIRQFEEQPLNGVNP